MEQGESNQQQKATIQQSWQSRTPFFYGWVIVGVVFLALFEEY